MCKIGMKSASKFFGKVLSSERIDKVADCMQQLNNQMKRI